jgi:hypothetical protein
LLCGLIDKSWWNMLVQQVYGLKISYRTVI